MSEFEVTALLLSEHDVFRREFAALEEADDLGAAWRALADRLEVHAVAEEEVFYPQLAQQAGERQETVEAVHDHNEIRTAVRAVEEQEVGSEGWWEAVRTAQEVNAEHMAEEERDLVPPFREAVDAERREELGLRWVQLHDETRDGARLAGDDVDPEAVAEAPVDVTVEGVDDPA